MAKKKRRMTAAYRAAKISKLNRMSRVRDLMLTQPNLTQMEMAARLGYSQSYVTQAVAEIFDIWLAETIETTRIRVEYYTRRYDRAAAEAFNAWKRSQRNSERVTTAYVPRQCPLCRDKTNPKCTACQGTGSVIEEQVTRQETGQAGDPSLLREYRESTREAAKVRGLYARLQKRDKRNKGEQHNHLHLIVDWDKIPAEAMLQIKGAIFDAESTNVIDEEPKKENL